MADEVIAALIAFSGVIISVLISVILSVRQTNTELKKIQFEGRQGISDQLLEARLRVYPSLYALLSNFDKVIRFGTASEPEIYNSKSDIPVEIDTKSLPHEIVTKLYQDVLKWDSQHAILLSAFAGGVLHNFRLILYPLAHMPKEEFHKQYGSPSLLKTLLTEANKVEFALKSDIGIYNVEFLESENVVFTYENLREFLIQKYEREF